MPKPVKIGEGRTLSRLSTPAPINWGGAIAMGVVFGILAIYLAGKHK